MATLMVHLQLGQTNTGLLAIAADLARRLDAQVIGVAACQPMQIAFSDGFYYSGELMEQDRRALEEEIHIAESEFRQALIGHPRNVFWRSAITLVPLAAYLARQARGADLLITGIDRSRSLFDPSRHIDTGDLVMQSGRPVLIIPDGSDRLPLTHAMIGWNDSREIRRATFDALTLLRLANQVSIVTLAAETERETAQKHLEDVVAWLEGHGIPASPRVAPLTGNDSGQLNAIANDGAVDLMVVGAYGHSRLREWILGGVTRDLVLRAPRCTVASR